MITKDEAIKGRKFTCIIPKAIPNKWEHQATTGWFEEIQKQEGRVLTMESTIIDGGGTTYIIPEEMDMLPVPFDWLVPCPEFVNGLCVPCGGWAPRHRMGCPTQRNKDA